MRRIVSTTLAIGVLGFPTRPAAEVLSARPFTASQVAVARPGIAAVADAIAPTPFERAVGDRMRGLDAVMVEVEMRSEAGVVGHGSGVFITATGDVLTAGHVVADPKHHFRVVLADGSARDAYVAAKDVAHDAALLRAPGKATPFVRAIAGAPARGAWVVCAGFGGDVPAERLPMRSAGLVADPSFLWSVTEYKAGRHMPIPNKTSTFAGMVRTDCGSAPGMSGGPVVNLAGELVGVMVGSNGVVSPVSGFRRLLPPPQVPPKSTPVVSAASPPQVPPKSTPVVSAAAEPVSAPKPIAGADGAPSRDASVAAEFSRAKQAVVELSIPGAPEGGAAFTGVIVSSDGLVVAPAVRLRKKEDADESIDASQIVASQKPGARCTAVLAIRGELALLRFSGLVDDTHQPVGAGAGAALGELVEAITPGDVPPSVGFVTAELRHPGVIALDGPRWGCGLIHMTFARANPPVRVGAALASDVGWFGFGSLVVDRSGHPVALAVASRAPGLNFSVPWADVLDRFRPWLANMAR